MKAGGGVQESSEGKSGLLEGGRGTALLTWKKRTEALLIDIETKNYRLLTAPERRRLEGEATQTQGKLIS